MTPLALPRELTIRTAADTRDALLRTLQAAGTGPWVADAGAVGEADTAGVQLLLALQRSAQGAGVDLQIVAPSQPLVAACRGLGVVLPFATSNESA